MYYEKPKDVKKRSQELLKDTDDVFEELILMHVIDLEEEGYVVDFEKFDSKVELAPDPISTIIKVNGHTICYACDLMGIENNLSAIKNVINLVCLESFTKVA